MPNDFSPYYAGLIVDHLSQGVDMPAAPGSLEVALFDDAGNEISSDLENGRLPTTAGSDWDVTDTQFSNASELNFGESLSQITVAEFALIDPSGNELIHGDVLGGPYDYPSGSRVFAPAGQLSTDILD